MLLTVCIEAGRSTLTHTSWTGLAPVSRKWMSGQAAALAATQDRTPFVNLSASCPLRDLTLPGVRRPPSRLDFYLSWMCPNFPAFFKGSPVLQGDPLEATILESCLGKNANPPLHTQTIMQGTNVGIAAGFGESHTKPGCS